MVNQFVAPHTLNELRFVAIILYRITRFNQKGLVSNCWTRPIGYLEPNWLRWLITIKLQCVEVVFRINLHGWLCFAYQQSKKVSSTLRTSRAVTHPSTIRALRGLTSEFRWDPVHSTQYGRWRIENLRSCCHGGRWEYQVEQKRPYQQLLNQTDRLPWA